MTINTSEQVFEIFANLLYNINTAKNHCKKVIENKTEKIIE